MSINPIKEFFKRRKGEAKFSRAGPGQTLSSDASEAASSSRDQSSARQAAAEAAMKRFNKDNTKPAQRPKVASSTSNSQPSSTRVSDSRAVEQNKPTEVDRSIPQKELPVIDGVAQRNVQVYSTEELARRIREPDIDDEFFRLTVEDAKLIQQRYNEERSKNEILRTSEMRRRDQEQKRPTTNVARLRFKLPNELVLEASFSGSESFSLVRDWLVATCLDKVELNLQSFDILLGLRPFKEADFSKTVKQLGLIPASTLTIIQKGNN